MGRPVDGLGGCFGAQSKDQSARRARATAANWELTPSFWSMALICERTVEIDTNAARAISSAQWPSMSSAKTLCSRSVRTAKGCSWGSCRPSSAERVHAREAGDFCALFRIRVVRRRRLTVMNSSSNRTLLSISVEAPASVQTLNRSPSPRASMTQTLKPAWQNWTVSSVPEMRSRDRASISTRLGRHSIPRPISDSRGRMCLEANPYLSRALARASAKRLLPATTRIRAGILTGSGGCWITTLKSFDRLWRPRSGRGPLRTAGDK